MMRTRYPKMQPPTGGQSHDLLYSRPLKSLMST